MRWKIEVFHNILKSDCRAERARLRTAERLVRSIALFFILSWRVFWLTMLNRIEPNPRSPTPSSTASTSRASPSASARSRRRSTAATTNAGCPGLAAGVHGRLWRRPRPQYRGALRHAESESLPPPANALQPDQGSLTLGSGWLPASPLKPTTEDPAKSRERRHAA